MIKASQEYKTECIEILWLSDLRLYFLWNNDNTLCLAVEETVRNMISLEPTRILSDKNLRRGKAGYEAA